MTYLIQLIWWSHSSPRFRRRGHRPPPLYGKNIIVVMFNQPQLYYISIAYWLFYTSTKYKIHYFRIYIRKLLLIIFKLTDSFLFHVQSTHKPISGILHFCYSEFDFQHFLLIFLRVFISLFILSPWFCIQPNFSIRILNIVNITI